MKHAVYITTNKMLGEADGVSKKIEQQIETLRELDLNVRFMCRHAEGLQVRALHAGTSLTESVMGRDHDAGAAAAGNTSDDEILMLKGFQKHLYLIACARYLRRQTEPADYLYMRNPYGGIHPLFLTPFLFMVRKKVREIYLEIPHFPYDKEAMGAAGRLSLYLHRINRPFLHYCLDRVVYMGAETSKIWGCPTVRMFNGVNPGLPMQEAAATGSAVIPGLREPGVLRLVGVANLMAWHGYDRVVAGVAAYNHHRPLGAPVAEFHVVGGREPLFSQLKAQAAMLGVEQTVVFHGNQSGQALDAIFEKADIAVDALGRHRSHNNYNDSIKSKEYTLRGIPFVKSHLDDAFVDCQFVFQAAADESPIDIDALLRWRQDLSMSAEHIRDYAMRRFTWRAQFQRLMRLTAGGKVESALAGRPTETLPAGPDGVPVVGGEPIASTALRRKRL